MVKSVEKVSKLQKLITTNAKGPTIAENSKKDKKELKKVEMDL